MERASGAADAHAAWAGGAALSCLPLLPIAIDLSFMPDEAELVTHAGDSRVADNERKRRDSERQAYAGTAEVRPSSRARMKRRSESEMQTLRQKVYQHNYMQSYHAHARWTAGRHTVHDMV